MGNTVDLRLVVDVCRLRIGIVQFMMDVCRSGKDGFFNFNKMQEIVDALGLVEKELLEGKKRLEPIPLQTEEERAAFVAMRKRAGNLAKSAVKTKKKPVFVKSRETWNDVVLWIAGNIGFGSISSRAIAEPIELRENDLVSEDDRVAASSTDEFRPYWKKSILYRVKRYFTDRNWLVNKGDQRWHFNPKKEKEYTAKFKEINDTVDSGKAHPAFYVLSYAMSSVVGNKREPEVGDDVDHEKCSRILEKMKKEGGSCGVHLISDEFKGCIEFMEKNGIIKRDVENPAIYVITGKGWKVLNKGWGVVDKKEE